ncbi:MAG TPA: type II toxin-antitoxin system RelE/ParE family toxin [Thermoanaerobaculia bacterium]|nr:type II toxin-antitoxin system RelE/ParE family toxin [Thermoanaerobaculia bacterium]
MHRVRVDHRAWRELDIAERWWRKHRNKAPDALVASFDEALDLIREQPAIGKPVRNARLPGLRRILLSRVHYHLYYRLVDDVVIILSLWHASRRSAPRL